MSLVLVLWQRRVARLTGGRVGRADALHYLGDLLPNAAAIMATGALRIGAGAWHALMDRAADPATIAEIERLVGDWPGVQGYHDLKTRTAGSRIFVNLHLKLEGDQTSAQAHAT